MNNMEVVTTPHKDQRDRMYQDLRQNGNELERQVIRFSSCEPVLEVGEPATIIRIHGRKGPGEIRQIWHSTWSIAYPRI